jgi:hypothetical protein
MRFEIFMQILKFNKLYLYAILLKIYHSLKLRILKIYIF